MKCNLKRVLLGLASCIIITTVIPILEDKFETYQPFQYLQAALSWPIEENESYEPVLYGKTYREKLIVVPMLEGDDSLWLSEQLPE